MLGDFNVNTGTDDISKIGLIREWNYESKTIFFDGECSNIGGSSGDFFTPNIVKNQTLSLFSPEMCRSIPMDFEEELIIHGVKTYKFSGADRAVDKYILVHFTDFKNLNFSIFLFNFFEISGSLYSQNECFCNGECVPSGLFNVSACRFGTPVFMSFPHFYYADQFYHNQIDGMTPDKDKHQFFMSFEPVSRLII